MLRLHLVEQYKAPVKLGLGAAMPRAQQSHNARNVARSIQQDTLAALAIPSRSARLLVIPLQHTCMLRGFGTVGSDLMKQHDTHGSALQVTPGILLLGRMQLYTSMAFEMHQCTTKRTSGLSMPARITCLQNLGSILSNDLLWHFWRRSLAQQSTHDSQTSQAHGSARARHLHPSHPFWHRDLLDFMDART